MKEKNRYFYAIVLIGAISAVSALISVYSITNIISIRRDFKKNEFFNESLMKSLVVANERASAVKENLDRLRNYNSDFYQDFCKLSNEEFLLNIMNNSASRLSIYQASSNQQEGYFFFEMQGSWDNLMTWILQIEKEFIQIKIEETNFFTVGGDQITLVLKIKFLTPNGKEEKKD